MESPLKNRLKVLNLAIVTSFVLLSRFALANIVGVGTQNFNPVTDGLDYVTVQSSKTLKPGIFNLGGFYNYAVNSLPYVDSGTQSRAQLNDSLSSSDVSIGLGVLSNLSVGLSLPAVLAQSVENRSGVRGDFSSTGSTEVRFNTKLRFAGDDSGGYAAVASVNVQRTRNDPYAGVDAGPTYNLELVADHTFTNRIAAAVNVGYRMRNPGSAVAGALIDPMKNQIIASVAASYLLEAADTKLIGEIFGAIPAQEQGTNPTRDMTSAELLVGIKHDFTQKIAFHVGAGTELIQGVASPDWRVYTGLNYTFGPVWDKDSQPEITRVATAPQPESRTLVTERKTEKFSVGNILFKFDSADMVNDYPKILAGLVAELRRTSFTKLTIEGHTDSMGSVEYNNDLSLRRANAIRDYLITSEKVAGSKIEANGFGPSRPIASNGNYQGRQANRRVEFIIER
ncbi:hypothetical protein BH10BDE1_BH10BDE1_05440 [soil metagenome]